MNIVSTCTSVIAIRRRSRTDPPHPKRKGLHHPSERPAELRVAAATPEENQSGTKRELLSLHTRTFRSLLDLDRIVRRMARHSAPTRFVDDFAQEMWASLCSAEDDTPARLAVYRARCDALNWLERELRWFSLCVELRDEDEQ